MAPIFHQIICMQLIKLPRMQKCFKCHRIDKVEFLSANFLFPFLSAGENKIKKKRMKKKCLLLMLLLVAASSADNGLRVVDLDSVKCDKNALDQLVTKLNGEEFGKVCSLLIAKGDTLVLEQYFGDANKDKLHQQDPTPRA